MKAYYLIDTDAGSTQECLVEIGKAHQGLQIDALTGQYDLVVVASRESHLELVRLGEQIKAVDHVKRLTTCIAQEAFNK